MSIENKKLNKTSFEALINVGVFDGLGFTRKDLFDNVGNLLTPNKHSEIVWSNSEYSLPEIINKEVEATGLILSKVFSDDLLKQISELEIPDELPIGILVSKEEKTTKSGKKFLETFIYLPSGESIKASDFNLVSEKYSIGEVYAFGIRTNNGYRNLYKVFDLQSKLNDYRKKESVLDVTIFDNLDSINFSVDKIVVHDFNGDVVAVLRR